MLTASASAYWSGAKSASQDLKRLECIVDKDNNCGKKRNLETRKREIHKNESRR